MTREKAVRSARNYSKRHNCTTTVELVVKGRGKGIFECRENGLPGLWWKSSVVETIVSYKNGKRI